LAETQFLIKVSVNDFWGAIAIGFVASGSGRKILRDYAQNSEPKTGAKLALKYYRSSEPKTGAAQKAEPTTGAES
jgi:hypothetical protein